MWTDAEMGEAIEAAFDALHAAKCRTEPCDYFQEHDQQATLAVRAAAPHLATLAVRAHMAATEPAHDERCCMNGIPPGKGPHPDCPGLPSRAAGAEWAAGLLIRRGQGASEGGAIPQIVCLCGPARFGDAFRAAERERTEAGEIVLTAHPVSAGHRAQMDELHRRQIDLANYVLVINVGGYIGESTRGEIEYAADHGKPVRYLEQP